MVVITRKLAEAFFIGPHRVVIVRISGNRVRLGITAPKEVEILREEIVIKRERALALATAQAEADEADETAPDPFDGVTPADLHSPMEGVGR